MDVSPEYIKQCDCPEIQEQKPDGSQGEFVFCEGEAYQEVDDRPLTPFIWLPRQDELQEMIGGSPTALLDELYEETHKECDHYNNEEEICGNFYLWKPYYEQFKSMEQLTLAFAMKKCWNKKWSGEEWIELGV